MPYKSSLKKRSFVPMLQDDYKYLPTVYYSYFRVGLGKPVYCVYYGLFLGSKPDVYSWRSCLAVCKTDFKRLISIDFTFRSRKYINVTDVYPCRDIGVSTCLNIPYTV